MKTFPIRPARVDFNDAAAPYAADFDDIYHPRAGALTQAQHVFLAGNGLPGRWQGRDRFVILETGFGLGNNFLATWDAWRRDPLACRRLHFISIEQHPLTREAMQSSPRDDVLAPLARQLVAAWPPLTWNLHRLAFEGGRVELLLALGDAAAWLPELVAQVDAFYLDGFAPAKNPQMWQPRLFKAMGRMAAPGATAATWTAARTVREGLTGAGFEVQAAPGTGGKRDITLARFAPAFTPRRAAARVSQVVLGERRAAIVGAGLAGCAVAWALAEQGWSSRVFDRHAQPAQEASGNPAGLFHGIVNAQDGAHARFNRAAALQAQQSVMQALSSGMVQGELRGLLRLETGGATVGSMQALLRRLGLPPDYVEALDTTAASSLAGMPLQHPAWFYPGGGWVRPGNLANHFLRQAPSAAFHSNTAVHALERHEAGWRLLDVEGRCIDEADAVVLANAGDALRLLANAPLPLQKVRGQISLLPAAAMPRLPRLPIAGTGYLLPDIGGLALFGATSQPGDDDGDCRPSDHVQNLAQLRALTGQPVEPAPGAWQGRVGWRWVSADRLPVVGAVPDDDASARTSRLDQPRLVPRVPGLFICTGLGSRGIAWCPLAARVLASLIAGAPAPLESSLLDAVDPARFISRRARRPAR